jgi:acyl-CoA dehydrogenase
MDFRYTSRLAELKRQARDLAAFIMEYEQPCEEQGGLSPADHTVIAERVRASGLAAINQPAEWGGAGLSVLEQLVVQEELGKLTGALWDVVWRPANALKACTPEQRERWLLPAIRGERRDCVAITEPGAGSDPTNLATTAVPTAAGDGAAGGWRVSGEKWFVTVGDVADFIILLAAVQPEGAPTLFLVDKDTRGVRIRRTPRYMHTFVYEHPEIEFADVHVRPDQVLGEVGQGYELSKAWFLEERLMIAARTIGAAERALELASEWARERRTFGKRLVEHQLIQAMLADCVIDIATNRALNHQVAWEADNGLDPKRLHAKSALVKVAASEAAGRVVDRCVQVFGGRGYMREQPVERLYRELRVDRIWEGTSEIMRLAIGNEIAKRGVGGLLGLPMPAPGPPAPDPAADPMTTPLSAAPAPAAGGD